MARGARCRTRRVRGCRARRARAGERRGRTARRRCRLPRRRSPLRARRRSAARRPPAARHRPDPRARAGRPAPACASTTPAAAAFSCSTAADQKPRTSTPLRRRDSGRWGRSHARQARTHARSSARWARRGLRIPTRRPLRPLARAAWQSRRSPGTCCAGHTWSTEARRPRRAGFSQRRARSASCASASAPSARPCRSWPHACPPWAKRSWQRSRRLAPRPRNCTSTRRPSSGSRRSWLVRPRTRRASRAGRSSWRWSAAAPRTRASSWMCGRRKRVSPSPASRWSSARRMRG